MPALLETQRAFARALVADHAVDVLRRIVCDRMRPERRLAVHRQTFEGALTNALRTAFPAVRRLLGDECFTGAAWHYVHVDPPRSAWLDEYGATFPAFLASFAPVGALGYLADVARVEWAVNRALHAPDAPALDVVALAGVPEHARASLAFVAHPAIDVVACRHPADTIWRAVLAQDDEALAALDVRPDPAVLLVERNDRGVDVTRIPPSQARLTVDLLSGAMLADAIAVCGACDAAGILAEHLARRRFTAFRLVDTDHGVHRAA
ncbi:MAG TPA: DNA-binding domain-containing protein [Casimicrobiaceae bacterium]|jgi:hypothetical protein|nr:DNA-binding domain-containing protein [Casimicrobiaceae bacterium]